MSHSSILKFRVKGTPSQHIDYREYLYNGFLDGFHDSVSPIDKEQEQRDFEWFSCSPYVDRINDNTIKITFNQMAKFVKDLTEAIQQEAKRLNDSGLTCISILGDYINCQDGYYVDFDDGYYPLNQFFVKMFEYLRDDDMQEIELEYDGSLDYHC